MEPYLPSLKATGKKKISIAKMIKIAFTLYYIK